MSWYCVELSSEQIDFGFADIIRAELEELFIACGAPPDMSVWRRQEANSLILYISPAGAALATTLLLRFGGAACQEPDLSNAEFVLGNAYLDDDPTTD